MRTRALAEKVKGFFASGAILAHDANAQMQLVMFLNCRAVPYVLNVHWICISRGYKGCKIINHRNCRIMQV
jgi:hypothetical protein